MDKEVSLKSAKEAEHLVGLGCKVSLVDIQLEGSFTEGGAVEGEAIFEWELNFSASEKRKKFGSTASFSKRLKTLTLIKR